MLVKHHKLYLRLLPVGAGGLITLTLIISPSRTLTVAVSAVIIIAALALMILLRGYVWALEDHELS